MSVQEHAAQSDFFYKGSINTPDAAGRIYCGSSKAESNSSTTNEPMKKIPRRVIAKDARQYDDTWVSIPLGKKIVPGTWYV